MDNQVNVVGARPSAAERPQESGAAALGRGGRMSRQRKTAAVLRLLRGEDELCAEVGDGLTGRRRRIVGVFEPPLLHQRSDTP